MMQRALVGDRNELQKIDAKCYDYPLSFEEWGEIIGPCDGEGPFYNFHCEVYKKHDTIIGYVVFDDSVIQPEMDMRGIRLGVLPSMRGQGIGKILIEYLQNKVKSRGWKELQLMIPEYVLDPEENRGVDNFISAVGLVFHKQEQNAYYHYGKVYDGIIFRTGGTCVPCPC